MTPSRRRIAAASIAVGVLLPLSACDAGATAREWPGWAKTVVTAIFGSGAVSTGCAALDCR
jgi:hypothetical protein